MAQRQEYDEINLLDYLKVVQKHWKLIVIIVAVIVAATAIISLIMTPMFEAKAVITPVTQSGMAQNAMSAMASQFGLGSESQNASEIVSLLKSNIIRERVIRRNNLLPILFKKDALANKTEDQKVWMGLRYLKDTLKVTSKQKENTIEVSMQFKDPKIVADIVNQTLVELTDYMSSEAKRVANANRKYVEDQIDKTSDPFIKAKIYTLIAQQIETATMAEVKENFAFKVLDPPKVPDKKIKPKRALMVIIAFVISLFLGIFAAFGLEYVERMTGKRMSDLLWKERRRG